jgi:hypothetical protein
VSEKIYLLDEEHERLEPMAAAGFITEDKLQDLLARYPDLLSGDLPDRDAPRRWMLVRREMGIPDQSEGSDRWSVDHLFLDQDGIPTLVETKRSSDTRIRREVVGQMLDYAANCVSWWSVQTIRQAFVATCASRGSDPTEEIRATVAPDLPESEFSEEDFWDRVRTNLEAERIRLLFVADRIHPELQRVIEYLNGQMERTQVLGVEIRQFEGAGRKTLVPRVVGQTAKAREQKRTSSGGGLAWDRDRFMRKLEELRGSSDRELAERLVDWSESHFDRLWWSTSSGSGSVVPVLEHGGSNHHGFRLEPSGRLMFYFRFAKDKEPFNDESKRREWLTKLGMIPGTSFGPNAMAGLPKMDLALLREESALQHFLATMEWFIAEVRRG